MKQRIDAEVEKEMNDSIDEDGPRGPRVRLQGSHRRPQLREYWHGQNKHAAPQADLALSQSFFNRVMREFSSAAEQAQTARFMRSLHEVERIAASPRTSLPTIVDIDGKPLSTSGDSVKTAELIEVRVRENRQPLALAS